MAVTVIRGMPDGRVVLDTASITCLLEDDAVFASRFALLFERAETGGHELPFSSLDALPERLVVYS